MLNKIYSKIIATGSYIPTKDINNSYFLNTRFHDADGKLSTKPNEEIIQKFYEITGISERKYVEDNLVTSDIAAIAAQNAIESSGIDRETLDCIIFAHNFGNVRSDNRRSDFVPSLAARVKHTLQIKNPYTVAYDIAFGCPGWLQGIIQAESYIKSGNAKRALVIGAETLSRISDPHDRDSMIYSDGAGATIVEAVESPEPNGILSHISRSDAENYAYLLWMDKSYSPEFGGNDLFLKMNGHKLYKYALQHVPGAIRECLNRAGLTLRDIKKVLIHQANEKMDEEILKRVFELYDMPNISDETIKNVMPMTISWLGNSSVATLPTMLDLIMKDNMSGHELNKGDNIILASVGAGMNINAVAYKI